MYQKNDFNAISKVSIIMPTCNRAAYIMESIESVRNQTYQNWELLVVDDGSEDNTEELVKQIKDERIHFHKPGKKLGLTGARYEGMRKSKGALIAFIDSDDLWEQTKLEKQVLALQEYPEAGFSLTGGYNFRKFNEPLEYFYKQREGAKYGDMLTAFFKSEMAATMPSLIIRKECTQIGQDSEEVDSVEFILNLASRFKGVILYEPLLYRRLHDTNYSSINWVKRQHDGFKLIRSYKKSLPGKLVADYLFRSYINFGEQYLLRKNSLKAIFQFFKAWKHKPLSIIPFKKIGKATLQYFKK